MNNQEPNLIEGHIFLEYCQHLKQTFALEKVKEISEKIKEKPKHNLLYKMEEKKTFEEIPDAMQICDLKIKDDGSVNMYLKDAKEPIRFYPDSTAIFLTAIYKRLFILTAKNISKMGWLKRIITILALKFNLDVVPEWLDHIFNLDKVLLKEQHWSIPIREVRRVLKGRIPEGFMNALTLIIEFDSAYRYRFQDFIVELDKSKLDGFSIVKEVKRVFEILEKRDKGDQSVKYSNIKKLLVLALIFSSKTRKTLRDILKDVDLEKIRFSKEDLYWVNFHRGGYDFRGLTLEERQKDNIKLYGGIS